MNKTTVLEYLLDQVKSDMIQMEEYKERYKKALEEHESGSISYWDAMKKYNCYNQPVTRSKIKADLKMIRRVSLEIEKEL